MSKSLGSAVDTSTILDGGKNQEPENAIAYDDFPEIDQHALFQL
ncbi:hypothetical protein Hdeb2414_s0004g00127371 [Helianthus debilis subsp. tardiflorus]